MNQQLLITNSIFCFEVFYSTCFFSVHDCKLLCSQESGAAGQPVRQTQLVPQRVRDRGHRLEGGERGGARKRERV